MSVSLGTLGSPARAVLDGSGRITGSGRCTVGWWIGADDRWRDPGREAAVRQRLVDGVPVVETAMAVPGGDAVQRVFAVRERGDADVLVVEIENGSPVPFAVALVVGGPRVELVGSTLSAGGQVLELPGPPRRTAVAEGRDELWRLVTGGDAAEGPFGPGPARRREAAVVYPLAHRATLRFVLSLAEGRSSPAKNLPAAADAARSWQAHLARGMRVELPGGRLAEAATATRCWLLLAQPGRSVRRARRWWGLSGPDRRGPRAGHGSPSDLLGALEARLAQATPIWTWPGRDGERRLAEFCVLLRRLLVDETTDGLALCGALPPTWHGQGIEVHDAPTRDGTVSYAVRWHGDRPALLWDLRPRRPGPVVVRAPGLDPDWVSTAPAGEALLGASTLSRAP
jgi:hypothetical protein